jgi:dihydrolipoamide dehydrogenase
MTVLSRSRAQSVTRTATVCGGPGRRSHGRGQPLPDGGRVDAQHRGLGMEEAGVRLGKGGFVEVDRVSGPRPTGCTRPGLHRVLMLASVAAMQGRIAMWQPARGRRCAPDLHAVSSTSSPIRRSPPSLDREGRHLHRLVSWVALATNARAKMQGVRDGFVKLFPHGLGHRVGGVIVAPASELSTPCPGRETRLTVDQLAHSSRSIPRSGLGGRGCPADAHPSPRQTERAAGTVA